MESASEPREPRDYTKVFLTLLVAAILMSGAAVVYVFYSNMQGSSLQIYDRVELDDLVEVDYIGRLPDGRVFDTSILEIAEDDGRYPKSLTFSQRPNDSYNPLTMTAGKYGVEGGTIKGFALSVIGMRKNETRIFEVAPEDGYAVNPAMIATVDLLQEIPAIETIEESQFKNLFGADPVPMSTVTHYFWKWDVLILESVGGLVKYRNEPVLGQVVAPFGDPADPSKPMGWYCTVAEYNPSANDGMGKVVVSHDISPEDVYYVQGIVEDGESFVLWGYDAEAGTFQIHRSDSETGYNSEIAGRTLYFEVTIVSFVTL